MATGQPPFAHLEPMAAIYHIGSSNRQPDVPEDALQEHGATFVRLCLDPLPDRRPTAKELLDHTFLKP